MRTVMITRKQALERMQAGELLADIIPEGADLNYWMLQMKKYTEAEIAKDAARAAGKVTKNRRRPTRKEYGYPSKSVNYAEKVLYKQNALD